MPDNVYVTRAGFVQFDPNQREANGKDITDVTIKTPEGTSFRITIWPEFQLDSPIEKGDWLAVDGKFTSNTYQKQDGTSATSNQISAFSLARVKGVSKSDREVVSAPETTSPDVPF